MKKELTKAEEQIMHAIWRVEKGFAKDILEQLNEPKPAYNTVLTVIRVLVQKGFVKFNTYGKSNEYYPTITKEDYSNQKLQSLKKNYFNKTFLAISMCSANSFPRLVNFNNFSLPCFSKTTRSRSSIFCSILTTCEYVQSTFLAREDAYVVLFALCAVVALTAAIGACMYVCEGKLRHACSHL